MLGLAVKLDMVGSCTENLGWWIGFCAGLVSKLATPFGKYIQGSLDFLQGTRRNKTHIAPKIMREYFGTHM